LQRCAAMILPPILHEMIGTHLFRRTIIKPLVQPRAADGRVYCRCPRREIQTDDDRTVLTIRAFDLPG
jgi:hypothetical protein